LGEITLMALGTHGFQIAALLAALPAGLGIGWLVRREAEMRRPVTLPLVLGSLIIAAWSCVVMPPAPLLLVSCLVGWTLLALATIDALAFRLPDILTLPLVASGLVAAFFLPDPAPLGHLIGATAGFFILYAIAASYRKLRGREGLGLGDAKLVAAAGAWLGWQALPQVVLIGCAAAMLWIGIAALRRGRAALAERIPFGVPLCFAFWIVWLYGPLGM
jgi:leader peptidase (prepilin peptidase)/N-methyltransferase